VHGFDISQTEGEELPDLDAVRPKLLDGAAPEGIWDELTGHATSIGYEVVRDQRGSENGYSDFLKKQIGVRPNVSTAQAVKTLIHELAHALLHAEGPVASREVAEVEVESVGFIVCDALGFDSGEYSFPYVTRWAEGSTEVVKETAERAVGCAKEILVALETLPRRRRPRNGGGCRYRRDLEADRPSPSGWLLIKSSVGHRRLRRRMTCTAESCSGDIASGVSACPMGPSS
jgi:hypothetical protein